MCTACERIEKAEPGTVKLAAILREAVGADELPGNTLYAFAESMALGVDMLESDIYRTADGEIVVNHDATVDRTTNGSGAIADMTLAELQSLDAAHWYVPGRGSPKDAAPDDYVFRGMATGEVPLTEELEEAGYTPQDFSIPTLREVLERFPDVPINIELKTGPPADPSMARDLADLLAELDRTDDVVVASFQDQVLHEFKLYAPDVHTAPALLDGGEEMNERILRRAEGAMGPAGFLIADDADMSERNQIGLEAGTPEWVELSRGLESEETDTRGTHSFDESAETTQRAIWHHYRTVMQGNVA